MMPFFDFIEKLQNKPLQARKKILWLAMAISMLIILPLWFFSFKHSLSQTEQSKKGDNKEIGELTKSIKEIGSEIPSLKKSLQASVSSFFNRTVSQPEKSGNSAVPKSGQIGDSGEKVKPAKLPLSE